MRGSDQVMSDPEQLSREEVQDFLAGVDRDSLQFLLQACHVSRGQDADSSGGLGTVKDAMESWTESDEEARQLEPFTKLFEWYETSYGDAAGLNELILDLNRAIGRQRGQNIGYAVGRLLYRVSSWFRR